VTALPLHTRAAADRLVAALAAARDAFEQEDAITASAALDAVVTACAELDAARARLDEETLARARQLHLACATAALAAQASINEKLEQAAGARRAARAYGG
jgi:hypothetical protein